MYVHTCVYVCVCVHVHAYMEIWASFVGSLTLTRQRDSERDNGRVDELVTMMS